MTHKAHRKKEVIIMTKLDCTAVNCVYNEDKVCAKEQVLVSGERAHESRETCCESFKEGK